MRIKLILFVSLIVSYECDGGLFDGILGGAQEVHKTVHGVAGAFLGGLTQGGLNLNLNGHYGLNNQQRPPQSNEYRPGKPTETVVVVLEEQANNEGSINGQSQPQHGIYNNRPQNQNRPQNHHRPQQNGNWNSNNQNNFGQSNPPNFGNNNYGPPNNQGQFNRPNYGNPNNYDQANQQGYENSNNNIEQPNNYDQIYRPGYESGNQNNFGRPNNPNNGQNNRPSYDNVNNFEQPNNPDYGQNNNPGFGNQNQNTYGKPNFGQNNKPSYGNQNQNNFGQPNNPNFNQNNRPGLENTQQNWQPDQSGFNNIKDQHTTEKVNKNVENENKKPDEDEPLFVPLSPNEYVYGGDKIIVNAPKRETEDKPKPVEEDDEVFPIDVRFKEE